MSGPTAPPPVPKSFLDFLRAFGPGIVVVLTWSAFGAVRKWRYFLEAVLLGSYSETGDQ